MPLIGLGTFIGTQFLDIFPEFVMFIFLFLVLLYITVETVLKGVDMMKTEDAMMLRQGEEYKKKAEAAIELKRKVKAMRYQPPEMEKHMAQETGINGSDRGSFAQSDAEELESMVGDTMTKEDENLITISSKEIAPIDILDTLGAKIAVYTDDEINPTLESIFAGESNHLTIDKAILV
mmetsp:Transcript_16762/g.18640  ORF Transcript_16762/g.18640 Transcript_16762/m.18640 type:complete len:178 (+) Transcript_16762:439-972(+)